MMDEKSEQPPNVLYVQMAGNGTASYLSDPREIHDNGKPVYLYRLDRAAMELMEIRNCDKCDLCEDHHD
jgi:hypothetical protein